MSIYRWCQFCHWNVTISFKRYIVVFQVVVLLLTCDYNSHSFSVATIHRCAMLWSIWYQLSARSTVVLMCMMSCDVMALHFDSTLPWNELVSIWVTFLVLFLLNTGINISNICHTIIRCLGIGGYMMGTWDFHNKASSYVIPYFWIASIFVVAFKLFHNDMVAV